MSLISLGFVGFVGLVWASKWPYLWLRRLGSWGLWMAAALSLVGMAYTTSFAAPKGQKKKTAVHSSKRLQRLIDHLNTVDLPEKGTTYLTIREETREALLVTPLRERQLALKVDRPTKLHVGFGVRVVGPGEGRVTFELVAQKGTEETRLIHETMSVTEKSSAWHDRLVDLRPWVGEGVKLTFSIRPNTTHEHLTAAWSTPYPTSPPASAASRPHVIFISLDTLRADHLSGWGYRRLTSPYIDALAQQGTRFSNHWGTENWTLPSHMSMLTGRYAFNHLVGLPRSTLPQDIRTIMKTDTNTRLDPAIPTLAEILKEQGYVTVAVTGGRYVSPDWFKRGFLRFRISEGRVHSFLWDLEENLEAVRRLLESHGSERLFLFFHTYKPHKPYLGRFFIQDERIPAARRELRKPYPNVVVAKALYDGDIKITDAYIGLLLQLLEKKGILKNAIVVLTSDHGEAFGEHGQRGHRTTLFDEEFYIPLVLVYPARVPAGRTVKSLTRAVDIVPTVLDLLDISPPAPLDGESLLPLLEGDADDQRTVLLDGEGSDFRGAKALRTSRYKLIGFTTSKNGTFELDLSRSALYDLEADPGEKRNRLADLPEVAERLGAELLQAFQTHERNLAASRGNTMRLEISKERLEQLKALGYLQ